MWKLPEQIISCSHTPRAARPNPDAAISKRRVYMWATLSFSLSPSTRRATVVWRCTAFLFTNIFAHTHRASERLVFLSRHSSLCVTRAPRKMRRAFRCLLWNVCAWILPLALLTHTQARPEALFSESNAIPTTTHTVEVLVICVIAECFLYQQGSAFWERCFLFTCLEKRFLVCWLHFYNWRCKFYSFCWILFWTQ